MTMTDPIADLLTRIKNASSAGHAALRLPASRVKHQLALILAKVGYVTKVSLTGEGKDRELVIHLKYVNRLPAITGVTRVSKAGRRVYRPVANLPHVLQGKGIAIISTSQGMMTDKEARAKKLGGEVIATIW